MITQQLTVNQGDQSGRLVIDAAAGAAQELIDLAEELDARDNVQTNGTIFNFPDDTPPPING